MQPLVLLIGEQISPGPQRPAGSVERVTRPAPMPEGVLLYSLSASIQRLCSQVRSAQGAVSAFRLVCFPGPPPEPDVRLSPHPALHEPMPMLMQVLVGSTVWGCLLGSGTGLPVLQRD